MNGQTYQQVFNSIVTARKLGGTTTEKITCDMIQQVSLDSLYVEGFRNWDGTMVLLPLWALAHMQPGEQLKGIIDAYKTVGTDYIDDDTRGGCIAYGVPRDDIPKKERA